MRERTGNISRDDLLDYWNNMSKDEQHRERDALIKDMAHQFDVSEEMTRKIIAEWEAGKNGSISD